MDPFLDYAVGLGRHPGARWVRALFDSGQLDQDGEGERLLAVKLADVGLFPVWGAEVLRGVFPDAAFFEASLVLEYQGRRHHTIDADMASDASREAVLRADGWHVEYVTGIDLVRRPDETVARVAALHQQRVKAGRGRPHGWRPLRPGRRLRPPRHAGR